MKKIINILVLLCIGMTINAQAVGPGDWSSVRLYGHAYALDDFTEQEYGFVKDHYNLFTIEKRHAKNVYGDVSSERASAATAAKMLANDSTTKPLFYWNAKVIYETIYETIQETLSIHPEWAKNGVDGGSWLYEDTAFATWFVDVVKDQVNNKGHAGVFLDAAMQLEANTEESPHHKKMFFGMMDQMPGIVIYNGYTSRGTDSRPVVGATTDYMEHADGVFVEHFFSGHCDALHKGELLLDELIKVPNDKIVITHSHPDVEVWNAPDHKFSLAAFLIMAKDNSYFHYFENGYSEIDLMMWHDEYGKPLGAPLALATKNGYVYTRTFENAYVTLDLENKTSSIDWIDNSVNDPDPIENLALSGMATQSSDNFGGIASRANDGNTNGAYGGGSVTHTEVEDNPWWQVDLGASYNLSEISVYNRTDSPTRLSNFTVYVLDEDSVEVYSQTYTTYPDPSVTMDAGGVNGRYVVVQINGRTALCLAEVLVAESVVSETKNAVSVKVVDAVTNDSIPLATLMVNGDEYITNYVGEMALKLVDDEYTFSLSKNGYETLNGTLNITQDTAIILELTKTPTHELSIKVTERGSYIGLSDVSISIGDELYSTSKIGAFSISLYNDLYDITLSKTGYQLVDLSVNLTKDSLLNVKMDREKYSLGFKVVDADSLTAIPSVAIDINDTVYTSDALGMVSLDLAFGEFDYMISAMGYDNINQSIDLVNDTMLVISMESTPSSINNTVSDKMVVSPNPTSNTFTLGIDIKEATLFDMSGKQVAHFINTQGEYDISSLAKGLYVLNAIMQNGDVTFVKLIKE